MAYYRDIEFTEEAIENLESSKVRDLNRNFGIEYNIKFLDNYKFAYDERLRFEEFITEINRFETSIYILLIIQNQLLKKGMVILYQLLLKYQLGYGRIKSMN